MANWDVTPIWRNETVFIVAGGPSVASEDLSVLKGRRVIVINSSFHAVPNADYLIFADNRWWIQNEAHVRKEFKGQIVSVSRKVSGPDVFHLGRSKPSRDNQMSMKPGVVTVEKTTLQAALNLSVQLGASRIVLIGADMGRAADGSSHHHAPHPWKNKEGNRTWDIQMSQLTEMREAISRVGVEVINTSLKSRMEWWTKMPLDEAVKLKPIRRNPVGTSDSREYERLVGRKFRDYSLGHRRMYQIPMETVFKHGQFKIFEAGFGIGYGLDQMVGRGNVAKYVGCEPNLDSFNYTNGRHGERVGVSLLHSAFTHELALLHSGQFDHAFCIEVIEHVPADYHLEFLQDLRRLAPQLWFSTPDIRRAPKEGVRTSDEWEDLLKEAGFSSVVVDKNHWTYLYSCS